MPRAWQSPRNTENEERAKKIPHPRAGLSHARWRTLSPVEKIERQLGLNLDQICEIMSRPWEECDAAGLAIRAQVLCIFLAIGAKMIRAAADGTLDYEAACGRGRQREPRDFGSVRPQGSQSARGRRADAPACKGISRSALPGG
jgi:hypothetical protein